MAKKPSTELLNLDELAKDRKFIILDEVKHEVVGDTVETFVERARRAKDRPETTDMSQQFVYLVELVHDAIPSVPKDRLMKLTLAQLDAIVSYTLAIPKDVAAMTEAKSAKGKSQTEEAPSQPSTSASPSTDAVSNTESNPQD